MSWLRYYLISAAAAAASKLLQSCLALCDPIDGSLIGSSVPGILQARILEWVTISFSNPWKWKVKVKSLSHAQLLGTPWTAAYQASPSMGFSRQEYWSGVPLPSPFPEHISTLILFPLNFFGCCFTCIFIIYFLEKVDVWFCNKQHPVDLRKSFQSLFLSVGS